jgi:uncharacterized membrane protein YtjA (UPF0391 family)
MLYWSAVFFIVALIAGAMGFGGAAAASAGIAKVLFFVFLVGFVITLVAGLVAGNKAKNALTGP